MDRRSENSLLDRVGRSSVSLTLDDLASVVGDALKSQRKQIIGHVRRMIEVRELRSYSSSQAAETRFHNLHKRLTEVESELRMLKKGGLR
jgi:hypothetical protein